MVQQDCGEQVGLRLSGCFCRVRLDFVLIVNELEVDENRSLFQSLGNGGGMLKETFKFQ